LVENRLSEPIPRTNLCLGFPLGVTPFKFRRDLWRRQSRVPGLSYGVVCVIMGLAILVELPSCDRRTDERTYDDSIYRASIASLGKNRKCLTICVCSLFLMHGRSFERICTKFGLRVALSNREFGTSGHRRSGSSAVGAMCNREPSSAGARVDR